jgi:hypothetical protein
MQERLNEISKSNLENKQETYLMNRFLDLVLFRDPNLNKKILMILTANLAKKTDLQVSTSLLLALLKGVAYQGSKDLADNLKDEILNQRLRILETVNFSEYAELHLIKHRNRTRELSDGTIIKHGDFIGIIEINKITPELQSQKPVKVFAELFRDFLKGMIKLDDQIDSIAGDKPIKAITATSHLISKNIAQILGLDLIEDKNVSNIFKKFFNTVMSLSYSKQNLYSKPPKNFQAFIKKFRKKWKGINEIWISREKLREKRPDYEKLIVKRKER